MEIPSEINPQKSTFDVDDVTDGITMGLLNAALNIHVVVILMNVLLRKQQKMRENDRYWEKIECRYQ